MISKLGCHWMRVHPDGRDLDHIAKMQYPSVKLFEWHWSDRDACANLLTVLPRDSYILARDHPLSEQEIWSDPVGIGTRHANEWADKVHDGRYKLPTDRSFFLGRNEPDATTGDRNAIDLYTSAFLDRLHQHGLRGGAFNFSTGHPRTVDGTGNTGADYSVFERSHQSIVAGHHIGVLHIYGTAANPCLPGHYDRLKNCAWQDVQWVVGEMGDDEWLTGSGDHIGFHGPFNGHLNDYCAWLDTLIVGINDPRIHSYQVFTYDFSHPWSSFDTRDIRSALEGYQWQHTTKPPTPDTKPPFEVHLPSVGTGEPDTMYVNAPNGLFLRSEPTADSLAIDAAVYGDPVEVLGWSEGGRWAKVNYKGREGYMAYIYLANEKLPTKPAPQPEQPSEPVSSGDKWQRTINFILNEEGGYTANDEGNPANFGINQGANPDLDVKNITREQAIERYRTGYWQASGANRLEWPFCLLVMDAAVQHGAGVAANMLEESHGNMLLFQGIRQKFYGQIKEDSWQRNGRAWMNRMGRLLTEASKP